MSTRVGKNTRVSFPLWLVLLPVLLVCGLIGQAIMHPGKWLVVLGVWTLIGVGIWRLSVWLSRKMDQRDERKRP